MTQFLQSNSGSIEDLARILQRTPRSVQRKAIRAGLIEAPAPPRRQQDSFDGADLLLTRINQITQEHPEYWWSTHLIREYRPFSHRRFRIDMALIFADMGIVHTHPIIGIAIEIDGGGHAFQGGRHARPSDYAKRALLAESGWFCVAYPTPLVHTDPWSICASIHRIVALWGEPYLQPPTGNTPEAA